MAEGGAESPTAEFKVFTFKDDEKPEESLRVIISEVLDPQYGMYVWPCAVVLAQFVWSHRREVKDKSVLEIGAGAALPGSVAGHCGAALILSDSAEEPRCLRNCARSCEASGLRDVPVLGLSWGHISPRLLSLPKLDIILGSDVFYDPQDFEAVLVTVAFLFRKNPGAQFWTTYQVRSSDWSVELLLSRWGMRCEEVPLESFGADKPELAGSRLPGDHSIQMMIISPDDGRQSPQQPQHPDDDNEAGPA